MADGANITSGTMDLIFYPGYYNFKTSRTILDNLDKLYYDYPTGENGGRTITSHKKAKIKKNEMPVFLLDIKNQLTNLVSSFASEGCNLDIYYYQNGSFYSGINNIKKRVIATFGASREIVFHRIDNVNIKYSIDMHNGDVLVINESTIMNWKMSLPKYPRERAPHYSITIQEGT